jgi:hypothetical protein
MRTTLLTALAVGLLIAAGAHAQLPDKIKQGVKDAITGALDDAEGKAPDQPADAKSTSRPPARPQAERANPPGLSFSSVLNGVSVLPKNSRFSLNQIQATFIPEDCPGGCVVLRAADGKELYQFDWKPDRLKVPYTLLNFTQTTNLISGETSGIAGGMNLEVGEYVLDFYLPDEHFYTFPFAVTPAGDSDPFGDGRCFVTHGAWARWGYLYYRDANPANNLEWKLWLRGDTCKSRPIKARVEIVRDDDGTVVCVNRENTTHSVRPKWTRLAVGMVFPEGKEVPHGTYFKAKDLLETDGAYTLTMAIDGELYGKWKFEIADGKPVYTDRTLRGKANPLTFIEGGRDAFWYARQAED